METELNENDENFNRSASARWLTPRSKTPGSSRTTSSKSSGSGRKLVRISASSRNGSTQRLANVSRERRASRFYRKENFMYEELEDDNPEENSELQYKRLQQSFEEAQNAGLGGLNIDQFKEAIRSTVGKHATEEEIEILFMKVDANCDSVVDWEEYVTYNLLEYKEKRRMIEMLREKPFPNEIREIESRHRDLIIKISFFPTVRKLSSKKYKVDLSSGKYLTLSREGMLGMWTLSMKNTKYFNVNQFQDRNTQPWYTDMAVMYNVSMIAVSSTERDIAIFEVASKIILLKYYLTGLDNCITSMDYWVSPVDLNIAVLVWGDTAGCIHSINFQTALRGGPFGPVGGKKNSWKRISYPEILKGFVVGIGVKATKLSNIHDDWVGMVKYIPELDCFMSSCNSNKTALFFGDFDAKKSSVYFKVHKGVLCFDYSSSLNIIVTGGMDYMLRVWNPYVNNKAIVLLKGHSKPINHVILHDTKNQVISIDKGRSMRVFDLRDQTCLQQVSGRIIKLQQLPISAVFFNPVMKTIILAANQFVMLEKQEEEQQKADIMSHNKPVVTAIYNTVFQTVVSACQDSVVSIWDLNTGDKVMQFVNAHVKVEKGVTIPVEITAITFDTNGRRLVTGARDGTVNIWNFNNGSCLQKFDLPDNSDVTGLVCTATHFYVTGWGKAVYIFTDGKSEEPRKCWKVHHKEDILSVAYLPPNIIATGSYDGNIIVWSRETGQVYCRLNAFETTKPISESNGILQNSEGNRSQLDLQTLRDSRQSVASEHEEDEPNKQKKQKITGSKGLGILSRVREATPEDVSEDEEHEEKDQCEHPLLQALDEDIGAEIKANKYSREEYDKLCKTYESAVERILFLSTREALEKDTAVMVTSGAEGWIRFWSMHPEGGLLGQFNAAHTFGESILTITSDCGNILLFTGDTLGYVKIWDIKEYCIKKKFSSKERKHHIERMRKMFTFFRVESYEEKKNGHFSLLSRLKDICKKSPPPFTSNPEVTLKYPLLVNSFRAHIHTINSVEFVDYRDIIITGSGDCSIRLWTLNGQYIGTFGEKWKPLPEVITMQYFVSQIPTDIRRSGSAKTLKVLHGGETPKWQGALKIIQHRGLERLKKQFDHLKTKEDKEKELVSDDKLETSNILGKSYKRKVRHKLPPVLPKFYETPGSVAVYHALPFVELTSEDEINKSFKIMQKRRAEVIAVSKLRGVKKHVNNTPAIMSLFNKVISKPPPHVKKFRYKGRMKKVADRFQKSPSRKDVIGSADSGAGSGEALGKSDINKQSSFLLPHAHGSGRRKRSTSSSSADLQNKGHSQGHLTDGEDTEEEGDSGGTGAVIPRIVLSSATNAITSTHDKLSAIRE